MIDFPLHIVITMAVVLGFHSCIWYYITSNISIRIRISLEYLLITAMCVGHIHEYHARLLAVVRLVRYNNIRHYSDLVPNGAGSHITEYVSTLH